MGNATDTNIRTSARALAAGIVEQTAHMFDDLSDDVRRVAREMRPATFPCVVAPDHKLVRGYVAKAIAKAAVESVPDADSTTTSRAIQGVWREMRRIADPRARAPQWDEQYVSITRRRSYTSPFDCIAFGAVRVWGHHDGEWPRTQRSIREWRENRDETIAWLRAWCPRCDVVA